jgi:putative lipoprotein
MHVPRGPRVRRSTPKARSIAAALALLALPAPAAAEPRDPDPWLGRDKALHFGVSAALAAGGYAAGAALFDGGYGPPIATGTAVALGAGIAKESLDLAGYGDPSWKDLTWDVVGTAVGVGLAVLVHAAMGGPKASAAGTTTPPSTSAATLTFAF